MAVARKIQVERRRTPTANQAANDNQIPHSKRVARIRDENKNPGYSTTDEQFADSYKQAGMMSETDVNRSINRVERAYANEQIEPRRPSSVPVVRRKINRKKKPSLSAKMRARLRMIPLNFWIAGWAIFWYLGFQMPFAMISLAGLGMMMAAFGGISSFTEDGGLILNASGIIIDATTTFLAAVGSVLGFDFDPTPIFIVPFAITFLLGALQLILVWFVYTISGMKSLSGEGGGLKGLAFMFAFIGYALPILNLFPLIFLWMLTVFKYPK